MKTFYIAARAKLRLQLVQNMVADFEKRGYICEYDWTHSVPPKPYANFSEDSHEYGDMMIRAAAHADVFVLINDADVVGAYIEYGAARSALMYYSDRRIYIVRGDGRDSIFAHHPQIVHVSAVEDVFKDIDTRA